MNRNVNEINGWLLIDKPLGYSSAKVVAIVKKMLDVKKVGHAGTLDPLASGVLPLAICSATRLVEFLVESSKVYQFSIKFGAITTTADSEGEIVKSTNKKVTESAVNSVIQKFTGEIIQRPPIFSAIKINGKRAYDLARKNMITIDDMPQRKINIHDIKMLNFNEECQEALFRVKCSKGTYVRSLAVDIAAEINNLGYVNFLRREAVGKFLINKTITLDNLEKIIHNDSLSDVLIKLDKVLDDIPAVSLSEVDSVKITNGQKINSQNSDLQGKSDHYVNYQELTNNHKVFSESEIFRCYDHNSEFLGIVEKIQNNNEFFLKPIKIFK